MSTCNVSSALISLTITFATLEASVRRSKYAVHADGVDVIINTIADRQSIADSYQIRREALQHKVTNYTTLAAARAACAALRQGGEFDVNRLQDLHAEIRESQVAQAVPER